SQAFSFGARVLGARDGKPASGRRGGEAFRSGPEPASVHALPVVQRTAPSGFRRRRSRPGSSAQGGTLSSRSIFVADECTGKAPITGGYGAGLTNWKPTHRYRDLRYPRSDCHAYRWGSAPAHIDDFVNKPKYKIVCGFGQSSTVSDRVSRGR